MHILRIDSSVRVKNSKSRILTDYYIDKLSRQKNFSLKTRDVGMNPPAFPTDNFIKANYTIPANRTDEMIQVLKPSDELIDELFAADIIIISSPMYNFSISATLKAYIDNIIRVGRTFYIDGNGQMKGLLTGKKMVIITSRGAMSYKEREALENVDFQENYLKTVFQFIGISDITLVHTEAQDFGSDELKKRNFEKSREQLFQLAELC